MQVQKFWSEKMKQSDHVGQFFDDITQSMRLKFQGWEQDLPHQGEKGSIRERRVADFLKSILPKRYGVGSGHIINKQGNTSGQIDIIIYDALDGIRLPIDEYYSLFPYECVYASIEVKSTLTASSGKKPGGSIYDCVEVATKIKSLQLDDQGIPNDIPCIIFSYQSAWKEDIKNVTEWFHRLTVGTGKFLPDAVFVLDSGFLLCNYHKESTYTRLYKKAPLLKFVFDLLSRMQRVNVTTPALWNSYIKWDEKEVIATILKYT